MSVLNSLEKTKIFFIPRNTTIAICCTVVGWYGRRVALTHLPGFFTEVCVAKTIERLGIEWLGRLIANFIIAPLTVPTVVARVSIVVGVGCGYITLLVLNVVYDKFHKDNVNATTPSSTKTVHTSST